MGEDLEEKIYVVEGSTRCWGHDDGSVWVIAYVRGDHDDIEAYYEAKRDAKNTHRGKIKRHYSVHVNEIEIGEITPQMGTDARSLVERLREAEKELRELGE